MMMKCPVCGSVYEDEKQVYCLNDGTALIRTENFSTPTVQYGSSGNRPPYPVAAGQNFSAPPPPRKKKTVFWILGGVGVLMFVMFIGILIFVGLVANYKKTGDPLNSNVVSASPTPVIVVSNNAKYEPELKMAIKGANQAETTALATQNVAGLEKYYTGEALKAAYTSIDQLKKLKMIQISVLNGQDFQYFKVNEAATEAEVRVTETWEMSTFRVPDAKCLGYYPPMRLPQTIYLKKAATGWMIDVIVHDEQARRDPQPCPKKK